MSTRLCPGWQSRTSKRTKFTYGLGVSCAPCDARYVQWGLFCTQRCDSVFVGFKPLIDCGGRSAAECAIDELMCTSTAVDMTEPWVQAGLGFAAGAMAGGGATAGVWASIPALFEAAGKLIADSIALSDRQCPH